MTIRLLGRYRLDGVLGSGAFATVHRGFDEQLDDPVAVKILAENHAADPDMRDRFVAEGQVLRRIGSPHVVRAHDLAEGDDGRPFLVLELCDRGTVRERVNELWQEGWTAGAADVMAVARPLAAAIGAMSTAGVVHRDLTPSNLLLTTAPPAVPVDPGSLVVAPGERLAVTDLGFCKDLARSTGITAAGGTDGFQPPEQRRVGGLVDVRSDLWAASALLTWLIGGEAPVGQDGARQDLLARGVPADVVRAITAGLAEDPDSRPPDPDAWLAPIVGACRTWAGPSVAPAPVLPGRGSRRGLALGAAVAAVLVLFAVLSLGGGDDEPEEGLLGDGPIDLNRRPASVAPVMDVTPTPTPTPTPMATPTPDPEEVALEYGPALTRTWTFELDSTEGWLYEVEVVADVALAIGSYFEEDWPPPNTAVRTAIRGGVSVEVTDVTPGDREAPGLVGIRRRVGWFDDDLPGFNTSQCQGYAIVDHAPAIAMHCHTGDVEPSVLGEWQSFTIVGSDPADVDAVVEAYADRPLDFVFFGYDLAFGSACRVLLLADGSIVQDTVGSTERRPCVISGPNTHTYPPGPPES